MTPLDFFRTCHGMEKVLGVEEYSDQQVQDKLQMKGASMTHKEKIKACRKYKNKLLMIGKKELTEGLFEAYGSEVWINIAKLAEIYGYPDTLYVPDFVDSIKQ